MFCDKICRRDYHNRRAVRGAELYDFLMEWRYKRDTPDTMAQVTRLLSAYRTADNARRGGRPSWDFEEAQARLPLAFSMTNGDNR